MESLSPFYSRHNSTCNLCNTKYDDADPSSFNPCTRNFIWSGDTEKRKVVIVAWRKVCKPKEEGSLGLRSLTVLKYRLVIISFLQYMVHNKVSKNVWSSDIPPNKSLLGWRIMHDRVPTDEKLKERGVSLPSVCSCCQNSEETTFYLLFFQCDFALKMLSWLATILNYSLHFNSLNGIWGLCDNPWTPKCKVVIQVCFA